MVQALRLQGRIGRTQCGLEELETDVRLTGSLTGLLFRAREVWMSRDLWGFSFPVLVTFQSVKRKHTGRFYSADINCICPKKEPRSSQAKMQARPPGLAGNRGRALKPSRGPVSSSPNSPLKVVGAEVHSFLSTLMLLLAFSLPSSWSHLPCCSIPSW